LLWKSWDGEFVVYNSGSGDTHLLDPLTAEVLKNIQQGPIAPAELAAKLFVSDNESLDAYLSAVLRKLEELELIEPERP